MTLKSPSRPARRMLAALLVASAAAANAYGAYHVTAFENTLGYSQIVNGDLEWASAALRNAAAFDGRYAVSTNLCVSQLKLAELEKALVNCDRALRAAPVEMSSFVTTSPRKRDEVMTHLYSNRGVVKALSGDLFGARADFERALDLDPENVNAQRNLERVSAAEVARHDN